MKKLFLISSYCDSTEKRNILIENINKIKKLGADVFLLSPIELESDIIESVDYYFQTKENPITNIDEKTYIHWRIIDNNKIKYKLERFFPDYGWAALYQNKKLSQFALTFEYDIYYHIIYDTKINDGLINEILSEKVNVYYSNKATNGYINEFSLHYLPLDKTYLTSFENFINKNTYVGSHDLIHEYLLKWVNENNLMKDNFIVEEHINNYDGLNFFSILDNNIGNIFFEKFEQDQEVNKFVCYDLKLNNLKIILNDENVFDYIEEKQLYNTNMLTSDIKKIEVISGDKIYDCTDNYKKIGRTKILQI